MFNHCLGHCYNNFSHCKVWGVNISFSSPLCFNYNFHNSILAKPKGIIDLKGITPPSVFTKDPLGLIDMYLQYRGNNLRKEDIDDLSHAIIYMPALQKLDLGDNPIGDDGIRLALVAPLNLMPFQNVGIVFELSFFLFADV